MGCSTDVLLSIRPQYADPIVDGLKKYEFRRGLPWLAPGTLVLVYSTSPVKKIIGMFEAGRAIEDDVENLWNSFGNESYLSEEAFFKYFSGKERGLAIPVERPVRYPEPIDPKQYESDFTPPQSFQYVRGGLSVLCK